VVYLSNESDIFTEVYFDDLKVTVNEHPVVQRDDYYPFGLTHEGGFNRVTAKENRFLYNDGSELQTDLNMGIYMTAQRFYDQSLGRFHGIDALADLIPSITPSAYGFNNPIMFNDPTRLMSENCPEGVDCNGATVLDEGAVTVTASRLPANNSFLNSWLFSGNVFQRGIASKHKQGDTQFLRDAFNKSNQTIQWKGYKGQTEFGRTFNRFAGYGMLGISSAMLATVGSPLLIEQMNLGSITASGIRTTLFGTSEIFSKSYLTQAGLNASIETTNQLLTNGFNPSELDVADIASQGFLGLNTPQSAAFGAVVDFKPFSNDKFQVNLNSEAAVDFATGYVAGRVSSIPGIQRSGVKPLIQAGADLSMKVIANGAKVNIRQNENRKR